MSKIEDKYSKLLTKFKNIDHNDNEQSHIVQDKIYRTFIRDVANGKLTKSEITKISKEIKKIVIPKDKDRWYS